MEISERLLRLITSKSCCMELVQSFLAIRIPAFVPVDVTFKYNDPRAQFQFLHNTEEIISPTDTPEPYSHTLITQRKLVVESQRLFMLRTEMSRESVGALLSTYEDYLYMLKRFTKKHIIVLHPSPMSVGVKTGVFFWRDINDGPFLSDHVYDLGPPSPVILRAPSSAPRPIHSYYGNQVPWIPPQDKNMTIFEGKNPKLIITSDVNSSKEWETKRSSSYLLDLERHLVRYTIALLCVRLALIYLQECCTEKNESPDFASGQLHFQRARRHLHENGKDTFEILHNSGAISHSDTLLAWLECFGQVYMSCKILLQLETKQSKDANTDKCLLLVYSNNLLMLNLAEKTLQTPEYSAKFNVKDFIEPVLSILNQVIAAYFVHSNSTYLTEYYTKKNLAPPGVMALSQRYLTAYYHLALAIKSWNAIVEKQEATEENPPSSGPMLTLEFLLNKRLAHSILGGEIASPSSMQSKHKELLAELMKIHAGLLHNLTHIYYQIPSASARELLQIRPLFATLPELRVFAEGTYDTFNVPEKSIRDDILVVLSSEIIPKELQEQLNQVVHVYFKEKE